MRTNKNVLPLLAVFFAAFQSAVRFAQTIPNGAAIDAEVSKIMTHTHAKGMAVAVIDHGKVGYVHAYGIRNAKGDPLTTDTVMYGASLTKTVFAYTVMQLVDQGKLNLDTPSRTISTSRCRAMAPIRFSRTSTGHTRIWPTIRAGKRSRRVCA
jgi:CubicO group peptidase (beta-lactamase class C family)